MTERLFPDRAREHEHVHVSHIDRQSLDALLRIEELLTQFLILLPQPAPSGEERGNYEDRVTPETPKVGPKGKRPNPRSL